MDIIRNMKLYNVYNLFNSEDIINKLGKLPLIYKGNMNYFNEYINQIKNENKPFKNFIENYFVKNKIKYFVNEDYNYYKYNDTIRSNSYIETYNKYIKSQLGYKKYVNWVNFLNFLKAESDRSIKKLNELANHNVKFSKKKLNLV